jgi:putative heme iron utilization protein
VILISRIAQHTKNIQADPKVSLITIQGEVDDIQAAARLTYLANAARVPQDNDDTPARYYAYFPKAQDYHKVHDFDFYHLELVRARYIGGFGEIYWIEPAQLLLANPFSREEELRMVRHMNEDHLEAMIHYCQIVHLPLTEGYCTNNGGD